jgi:hypothetical protein
MPETEANNNNNENNNNNKNFSQNIGLMRGFVRNP